MDETHQIHAKPLSCDLGLSNPTSEQGFKTLRELNTVYPCFQCPILVAPQSIYLPFLLGDSEEQSWALSNEASSTYPAYLSDICVTLTLVIG